MYKINKLHECIIQIKEYSQYSIVVVNGRQPFFFFLKKKREHRSQPERVTNGQNYLSNNINKVTLDYHPQGKINP